MMFDVSDWTFLSEQQLNVIRWTVEGTGSLELQARAGCGKTFTLMQVAKAVKKHGLGNIAMMAFNKKIAEELQSKLEENSIDRAVAIAGTVHSFGFSAWRKANARVQVDGNKVNGILTRYLVGLSVEDQALLVSAIPTITQLVSLAKQRGLGLEQKYVDQDWYDIIEHHDLDTEIQEALGIDKVVKIAQTAYQESLRMCNTVVDFDDMILAPLAFKVKFRTYDWVLVDEAQDTNPARRALALAMLKPKGRMIFVGDTHQAIYGFTGADSNAMALLKKETKASTLHLTVTRRCGKSIVKLAQDYVPDITAHESAPEGTIRTLEFNALNGEKLTKNDAILCRNTAPLLKTAYSLIASGTACQVEGRDIGKGLIKLSNRWKVRDLNGLTDKLDMYLTREIEKAGDNKAKIQRVTDQVDCLRTIIERCQSMGRHTLKDLNDEITRMFQTTEGPAKVLTLSTVHRSKGREWDRVYVLDRYRLMPSTYAEKDWELEQETNLIYVAITRAKREFIDLLSPPKEK